MHINGESKRVPQRGFSWGVVFWPINLLSRYQCQNQKILISLILIHNLPWSKRCMIWFGEPMTFSWRLIFGPMPSDAGASFRPVFCIRSIHKTYIDKICFKKLIVTCIVQKSKKVHFFKDGNLPEAQKGVDQWSHKARIRISRSDLPLDRFSTQIKENIF